MGELRGDEIADDELRGDEIAGNELWGDEITDDGMPTAVELRTGQGGGV